MPSPNRPFGGFIDLPSAVDMMRAAAGIYVPNRAFRDYNATAYTGDRTGEDGLTWHLTDFRDWYWYGAEPGVPYGSQAGARVPFGAYDAIGATLSTVAMTSGQDIQNNHRVLASTIFGPMLPFNMVFKAHYSKPITLALVAQIPTTLTIGTHVKAYLGLYSSAYAYLGVEELVFDTLTAGSGAETMMRLLAHTKTAINSTAAYVQLHIGIMSPDSSSVIVNLYEASLMLNPDNDDLATDASPVLFLDMEDVKLRAGAGVGFAATGISNAEMLDGRRLRSRVLPDNLKYQFTADFMGSVVGERMRRLLTVWNLGTRGLGAYVPEPVPVCIDFGLGAGPFFAYYWPTDSVFRTALHGKWSITVPKYVCSVAFEEA